MKKKHLALILAAAMTVTSVDATALVSAADFSAEETAVQAEEETVAAEDETEETAEDASEEEVLTEAEDGEDLTAETEITEDAEELIKKTEQKIRETKTSGEVSKPEKKAYNIEVFPNFKKEEYKQAVDDMIHYIIEGDIYIANMTQQMKVKSQKKPEDVFWTLRKNNPSPFGGYLDYDDFQIVCASPERFLKMKKGHVETRPIKGTRKRGETSEEDMIMRKELETSEKDKSELLMIVDLERNDL